MREEYRNPAVRPVAKAYLEYMVYVFNRAGRFGERIGTRVTSLEMALVVHANIFWVVARAGTKQADFVDTYYAPRRTIRDGLAHMVKAGALERTSDGYIPSRVATNFFNEEYDTEMRIMNDLQRNRIAYQGALKA